MLFVIIVDIILGVFSLVILSLLSAWFILKHLAKDQDVYPGRLIVIHIVLWTGLGALTYLSYIGLADWPNGNWASGSFVLAAIVEFVLLLHSLVIIIGDKPFGKLKAKIRRNGKVNEEVKWLDVANKMRAHLATYWYWMLIATPLALGISVLFWLAIATIGIRVLQYANTELGAVIIFKDGKMSLAGFPLNIGISSIVGISSAVIASKIYLHRKRND